MNDKKIGGLLTERELAKVMILAAEHGATEKQIAKFAQNCNFMRFQQGQLQLILSGALEIKFNKKGEILYAARPDITKCPLHGLEDYLNGLSDSIFDGRNKEEVEELEEILETLNTKGVK